MVSNLQVLITARAILASPSSWTKGEVARTEDGRPTWVDDPQATCFCAIGAIRRAIFVLHGRFMQLRIPTQVLCALGFDEPDCMDWNDDPDRTHAEVLALFDAAISTLAEETLPT